MCAWSSAPGGALLSAGGAGGAFALWRAGKRISAPRLERRVRKGLGVGLGEPWSLRSEMSVIAARAAAKAELNKKLRPAERPRWQPPPNAAAEVGAEAATGAAPGPKVKATDKGRGRGGKAGGDGAAANQDGAEEG